MFTHNCGNLNPMSSLDGIEEALRVQVKPAIEVHKDHGKYVGEEMYHEAGYDSYLTARVMILLSAQLEAKGRYVVTESTPVKKRTSEVPEIKTSPGSMDWAQQRPPPLTQHLEAPAMQTSRFATKTMYEALMDQNDAPGSEDTTIIGSSFALNPNARPFPIASAADGALESSSSSIPTPLTPTKKSKRGAFQDNTAPVEGGELKIDSVMPPFASDFWRVYANKLRVFGTVEGLLDLDPGREE